MNDSDNDGNDVSKRLKPSITAEEEDRLQALKEAEEEEARLQMEAAEAARLQMEAAEAARLQMEAAEAARLQMEAAEAELAPQRPMDRFKSVTGGPGQAYSAAEAAQHTANSMIASVICHGILRLDGARDLQTFNIFDGNERNDLRVVLFQLMTEGLAALHTSETAERIALMFMDLICRALSKGTLDDSNFLEKMQEIQFHCSSYYVSEILQETKALISNKLDALELLILEFDDMLDNKKTTLNQADVLEILTELNAHIDYLKDLYNFVLLVLTSSDKLLRCTIYDRKNPLMVLKEFSTTPALLGESKLNWDIILGEGPKVKTASLHHDIPESGIICPPELRPLYHWFKEPESLMSIIDTDERHTIRPDNIHGFITTNQELLRYLFQLNNRKVLGKKDHSIAFLGDFSCMSVQDKKGKAESEKEDILGCQMAADGKCHNKIVITPKKAVEISQIMLFDTVLMNDFKETQSIFEKLMKIKSRLEGKKPAAKDSLNKIFNKSNIQFAFAALNGLLTKLETSKNSTDSDDTFKIAVESSQPEPKPKLVLPIVQSNSELSSVVSQLEPESSAMQSQASLKSPSAIPSFKKRSPTRQARLQEILIKRDISKLRPSNYGFLTSVLFPHGGSSRKKTKRRAIIRKTLKKYRKKMSQKKRHLSKNKRRKTKRK